MRYIGLLVLTLAFPAVAYASLVNINTADATLLDTLPHIGATLAGKIIEYRTQNGPFTTIEGLQKVTGIGNGSNYADIAPLITVGETDTSTSPEPEPQTDPAPPPAEPEPATEETVVPDVQTSSLININTADAALLETLPGIGPTKATAIVNYRTQQGLFSTIEDIQNVSGIGPATFADIEDLITVGAVNAPPTPTPQPDPVAPSPAPTPIPVVPVATQSSSLININTASAAQLDTLPGIGLTKATAIVDYRSKYGPFKIIQDIQNVSGIGASTFANIKQFITVGAIKAILTPVSPTPAPQPSSTSTSYLQVQAVEPINNKKNIQTLPFGSPDAGHEEAVHAPVATTNLAAAGAALPAPVTNTRASGFFHSLWTLGLLGVILVAGAVFIFI